ncbi:hypothetical protein [Borrelia coriaceae]|uniref:hypothetical protein n=2 Tax=Borrelia coriaceae TaxID=144 RepID=UPI001FF354F7|nr:hypothetical protein [Borrelia coriaceae]
MSDIRFDIKKSIFERVKSFIGFRIRRNFDVLKTQIPGRLKDISNIEAQESLKGFDIRIKVGSQLSDMLDSGVVYGLNFPKPSLLKIRNWASYKGLEAAAVPIWLKIKSKGASRQYTNWKVNLVRNAKDLLK